MEKFNFKGLLCPVFTPFSQDKKTINYDVIEKYGVYLKTKGIQGVFVNGVTGEGTTLRIDERKHLAEEWLKVCRKHGLTMVLCIGGADIADVYEMTEHAEKIGVDCIVLLPDLFYKPRTEEDLVNYFKDINKYVSRVPLFYYHIPEYTDVKLFMPRFCELVTKYVTNFRGIFYGHDNIAMAYDLFKDGYNVIVCQETLFTGLRFLGFDTFCFISLNLYPEQFKQMYEYMGNYKYREAYDLFNKYYETVKDLFKNQPYDFVEIFKTKFNKMVDFNLGGLRRPQYTFFKRY